MTAKMHAVTRECGQVSPDEWETYSRVLDLDPATTVAEIVQWIRQEHPRAHGAYKVELSLELEKP